MIHLPPSAIGGLLALVALASAPGIARAQADIFSRDTVSGVVDLRLGVADGEPSWTQGGFGKTRFGSDGDGVAGRFKAQADLVWKPRFTWDLGAVVDLQAQPDQTHGVDLGEAYLRYKPVPHGDTRFTARLGLFYPEISLEHSGGAWIPQDTITPSAINSWVGEELKVVGLEGRVVHAFAGQELSATGAVFYYGDTAGSLLAFRGWSFSDLKSSANGHFDLPPLSAFMQPMQPQFTTPVHEIDGRVGWYAQLGWRRHGLSIDLTRYDNGGDRIGADANNEWAWDTRLWNLSATWTIDPDTTLRGQVMSGQSFMGYSTPQIWIDDSFAAGYLLLTRKFGADALSARVDGFQITDNSWQAIDPNRERGWALTAAWRHGLGEHADLLVETLHVWSDNDARPRTGFGARQSQTVVQTALRLKF